MPRPNIKKTVKECIDDMNGEDPQTYNKVTVSYAEKLEDQMFRTGIVVDEGLLGVMHSGRICFQWSSRKPNCVALVTVGPDGEVWFSFAGEPKYPELHCKWQTGEKIHRNFYTAMRLMGEYHD